MVPYLEFYTINGTAEPPCQFSISPPPFVEKINTYYIQQIIRIFLRILHNSFFNQRANDGYFFKSNPGDFKQVQEKVDGDHLVSSLASTYHR